MSGRQLIEGKIHHLKYLKFYKNIYIFRYNSGVMLLNLEVLKKIDWPKLWTRVTKRDSFIYGTTKLADQDIINAVIKENHHLVYEVPCVWNTQLSDRTLSYNCYRKHKPKVIFFHNNY